MSPAPNRRWLRFSLRTMFVAFTVVAIWLGWNVQIMQQRRAALTEAEDNGYEVWTAEIEPETDMSAHHNPPTISMLRRMLGDEAVYGIWLPFDAPEPEFQRLSMLFPEARIRRSQVRDMIVPYYDFDE